MNIGIDASDITPNKAGIGYYSYELTKAMLNVDKDNHYTLFTNEIGNLKEFENLENVTLKEFKSKTPNIKWIIKVSMFLRKNNFDAFISPSYFMFGVFFPRTIQVIHDLAPIHWSSFWPKAAVRSFKWQLKLAVGRVKHFVTNSDYTKRDLNKTFPKTAGKTTCIGSGLHEWTKVIPSKEKVAEIKERYDLPESYLLSISTLQPRKNYSNAVKAFRLFLTTHPDYCYLIGGKKGWYYEEIFKVVKDLNLVEKVRFLDYIPEEDMPVIYDCAKALVYISFEEGAGLPSIEAYARGIPVVASDIEVHREVMEDNAIYVDPNDPKDISEGMIEAILRRPKVSKEFIDKYSWDNVARKLMQIYVKFT